MRKKLLSILALTILLTSALVGCSETTSDSSTLTILSITEGAVFVMKAGTDDWTEATVEMTLQVGDIVKTADDSGAEITFFDGSTIELEAGTQIEITSLDSSPDTGTKTITLMQTIGTTISRVTKLLDPASSYEVETPTGVAAVRGSIMQLHVIEDYTTWITNLEGDIWALAQSVELQVPKGRQCIIRPGQRPELVMISAGDSHTVGLKSDSTVVAVGWNEVGQCDVDGWMGITQVAAGQWHTVGIKSDGAVVALGDNAYGQCNVDGWTGITQIAAGQWHTVGLKSDGTVVAVGDNAYGQCNVSGWTDITQFDASGDHTVGLRNDGTVVAVGGNDWGQCDVGSWTDIIQVAAGEKYTVGLKSDGTTVALGFGGYGQCNVGNWSGITQVAAGGWHTVGLKSDGTVVAVGDSRWQQCNVDHWAGIIQVAAGHGHTVGLKSDGTVLATGWDCHGQSALGSWDLK